MSGFLSVDLLTDFAAFYSTDFIDWRYISSGLYFRPSLWTELLPPWTKELYLCTVAPLLYLLSALLPPPPFPNVQYVFTDSVWHRVHILVEMKQGQCICPHSWIVQCNCTGEGKCNERGWACTPPPSPARTDFTLITECTPESSGRNSVYSVVCDLWGGGRVGGGVLKCTVDHILRENFTLSLTRFRTYKIASPPQTKMTSKDDIKGLMSLKFLRPWVIWTNAYCNCSKGITAYVNGMGRSQKVLTSILFHRLPSLRVKFAPFSVFFTKKKYIW